MHVLQGCVTLYHVLCLSIFHCLGVELSMSARLAGARSIGLFSLTVGLSARSAQTALTGARPAVTYHLPSCWRTCDTSRQRMPVGALAQCDSLRRCLFDALPDPGAGLTWPSQGHSSPTVDRRTRPLRPPPQACVCRWTQSRTRSTDPPF